MSRVRVLLCEHDPALESVLLDLFAEEEIDVVPCSSYGELEAGTRAHPDAVVVSDSWVEGGLAQLTELEREQLRTLGSRTPVIMTTGRDWAKAGSAPGLGERVIVIPKPYDIDDLVAAIRAAAS